ncbi:MAG: molecular chaperone [Aquificaceae bacterium]|jgi:TorA maturation chaperone TorD|uniref:TorD/DmsD family molecular chaperone n=1 Tax=Hydrogenobacter sp. Uz 6-8 TaxID=3384828 RepID=UPI000F1D3BD2|nr:MAG: nitrate reductase [Aquificota bacterium]
MELYKAFLYKFISLAFEYPGEDSLKALKESLEDLSLSLRNLGIDFDVEALKACLQEYEGEERLLDLQCDWNSLFATSLKAPSWETAYELEKAGRKAQELADIEGFYRAFGLEVRQGYEPDGLIPQLEFLSLLLLKKVHADEAEKAEIASKGYEYFFRDHLGRWYRLFCQLVEEETQEEYYRLMSKLMRSFLDRERQEIGVVLDLIEYRKEMLEGSTWECGIEGKTPQMFINQKAPPPS